MSHRGQWIQVFGVALPRLAENMVKVLLLQACPPDTSYKITLTHWKELQSNNSACWADGKDRKDTWLCIGLVAPLRDIANYWLPTARPGHSKSSYLNDFPAICRTIIQFNQASVNTVNSHHSDHSDPCLLPGWNHLLASRNVAEINLAKSCNSKWMAHVIWITQCTQKRIRGDAKIWERARARNPAHNDLHIVTLELKKKHLSTTWKNLKEDTEGLECFKLTVLPQFLIASTKHPLSHHWTSASRFVKAESSSQCWDSNVNNSPTYNSLSKGQTVKHVEAHMHVCSWKKWIFKKKRNATQPVPPGMSFMGNFRRWITRCDLGARISTYLQTDLTSILIDREESKFQSSARNTSSSKFPEPWERKICSANAR